MEIGGLMKQIALKKINDKLKLFKFVETKSNLDQIP